MITLKQIQMLDGRRVDYRINSLQDMVLEASHLTLFPALIDPHVHFRVPGAEHKETWETGARAALAGGVTTVLDMPNNTPACTTLSRLHQKKELIEGQLQKANLPLRYGLYFGADRTHLSEIPKVKEEVIGLKIYMGSSTGDLLMDESSALEDAFQIAAQNDLLVAVHAEDETLIQIGKKKYEGQTDPATHSLIRNSAVAARAVGLAIELTKRYGNRLYVVHTSTADELSLIRQAKKEGLPVYAEAAPHHLFLTTRDYGSLGTKALVNPPLRTDTEALWEAIHDETIDTIGTDHAPHTLEEKNRPYGQAPSGFPSIELYFPLLLNAHHQGKLTLERIVSLTHTRPREIFNLPLHDDLVLVDLQKKKRVDDASLYTKAKWSPYAGQQLTGWPRYTVLKGHLYDLEKL